MINMMKMMKMKNVAFALVAILAITVSCEEDFLDVGATGSLGEAQLTTSSGIDGTLIGAYSALNGVFGNRFEGPNHQYRSVTGGEANKGTDPGDYSSINPVQRYETDPTSGDLNNLWRGRYEGISRANKAIQLVLFETTSAAEAARVSGEARLLRGHFYFDLKKHFNNVPYIDETIEAAEVSAVSNSPGVSWANIIADFEFAFNNLPEVQAQAGHVNKWAAAAYLGKPNCTVKIMLVQNNGLIKLLLTEKLLLERSMICWKTILIFLMQSLTTTKKLSSM